MDNRDIDFFDGMKVERRVEVSAYNGYDDSVSDDHPLYWYASLHRQLREMRHNLEQFAEDAGSNQSVVRLGEARQYYKNALKLLLESDDAFGIQMHQWFMNNFSLVNHLWYNFMDDDISLGFALGKEVAELLSVLSQFIEDVRKMCEYCFEHHYDGEIP